MAYLVLTGDKENFIKAAKNDPATFAKYIDLDVIKREYSDNERIEVDVDAPYDTMIDLFKNTTILVDFDNFDFDIDYDDSYLDNGWDDDPYLDSEDPYENPYEDYYDDDDFDDEDYEEEEEVDEYEMYDNLPMFEKIRKS